jgi:hypothetical protein
LVMEREENVRCAEFANRSRLRASVGLRNQAPPDTTPHFLRCLYRICLKSAKLYKIFSG